MNDIRSFRDDLRQLARFHASRPALIDARNDLTLNYADLAVLLSRLGPQLQAWNHPDSRVVYAALPNSLENLATFLACMREGWTYAPIAVDASSREALRLAQCAGPGICLIPDSIAPSYAADLAAAGIRTLPVPLDGRFHWVQTAERFAEAPNPGRLLITTSGTTGEPKVMAFNTDVLWSSAKAFSAHHGFLDAEARYLNILPMSYLGGLFNLGLIPLSTGGSTVVAEAFSGKTFLSFWQTVERFDINTLWLVPTIVRGLLGMADRTHRERFLPLKGRIRASFLGTAPISLQTKTRFEDVFGIALLENFALSETTFFTSETLDSRTKRQEASVGEILPYAAVEIRPLSQESAEDSAPGGEIWVKTPCLFEGYLEPGQPPRLPTDERGFFPTGDIGTLSGKTLVIQGRTRDIIKRGGMFVSLRELELATEEHPDVAEAAAVCVAHDFYGEDSVICARPRPGASPNAADVLTWLHGRLAKSKWPARVVFMDDFPRTRSGKIRKKDLGAVL